MDEYIARPEFTSEIKRIDEENKRQNGRIGALETTVDTVNRLVASIEKLTVQIENMQKQIEQQGKRLERIEQEPADKWKTVIKTVLTVAITAAITYFLSGGGV